MGKRRYITFKVDEDLPDVANLGSQGRVSEPLGVQCGRCLRFTGFCCVCTCTLFQALAPPMLAVMEVAVLLLLLLLLPHHASESHAFSSSLDDLVAFSCIRAAVISGTYTVGSKRFQLRVYLVSSYVVGAAGLLYALIKAALFLYDPLVWLRPAAMMITFAVFSWLHILAARHTVLWARRRGQLGLAPLAPFNTIRGLSRSSSAGSLTDWDSSADVAPELLADPDSQFLDVDGLVVHYKEALPPRHDTPATSQQGQQQPEQQEQGEVTQQEYGEAAPSAAAWMAPPPAAAAAAAEGGAVAAADTALADASCAVVLVHGFGGGVFAWRHVLQPLAAAVGARVIAFDRPGFGLTARPEVDGSAAAAASSSSGGASTSSTSTSRHRLQQPLLSEDVEQAQPQPQRRVQAMLRDPYSQEAQAELTLRFCGALGLRRVVLLGQADGCLVVLHAAALAMHAHSSSPHHHHHNSRHQQHHQHQAGPGSNSGARPSHTKVAIQPARSVDFSWMGSLAATPEVPQQQQQQQTVLSPSQAAAATDSSQQQQQQQQCNSLDSTGVSSSTPSASTGGLLAVEQQLKEVQSLGEGGEAADTASPGSSISLQSMLQPGAGSSSSLRQQHSSSSLQQQHSSSLLSVGSSGISSIAPSETASGKADSEAQQLQQGGGDAGWALQPPLLQPPMTSSHQGEVAAAASTSGLCVRVCGLVLLHPNLSGHQVPAFTRLLAATTLGRSMLRPLLRTEVGEVTNRRAWHNPDLITRETLALYRRPLRVQGWDAALLAVSRAAGAVSPKKVAAHFAAVRHLPCLLVTGEHDRIATPVKVSAVAGRLSSAQQGIVPACGHLSHEEAPAQLLQFLVPFCRAQLMIQG